MSEELTVNALSQMLRRRQTLIIRVAAACFVLGIVCSFAIKPRYKSNGELDVQRTAVDNLGLESISNPSSAAPSDGLETSIALQTQAKILQSDSMALKVVEHLNLDKSEDFKPVFNPISWALGLLSPSGQKDPSNASLEDSPHRRDHALKVFHDHLKIKPESGTRLIGVQYTSSDPHLAAAVVNDLMKSLVNYNIDSRFAATADVSKWLNGQLGEMEKEADRLQGRVEDLQRKSGLYSLGITDNQGKEVAYSVTLDRLQQATQALSNAEENRIMKGGIYKMVQNGDPELISGLAGSSLGAASTLNTSFQLVQSLRTQQSSLASQFASDRSKYGAANPKLLDERASLDALNAQIAAEIKRIGERAANDYKTAQIVENNTRAVYDRERSEADATSDKAVALLLARQEATDARNLYQTLSSHLKEAGVLEGLRSSNISIVDPGRVPSRPMPDVLIALAGSLFIGCFAGVGLALFIEATNTRVDALGPIEMALNTSILGVLPSMRAGSIAGGNGLGGVRRRLTAGPDTPPVIPNLIVLDGPNTAYGEALRALRTSLVHPATGVPPRTVLVTSASEKEGKSTLSLNLAAALALNGAQVLLVDADMRSAGLSTYMGYGRRKSGVSDLQQPGLSDVLSKETEPEFVTPFPEFPNLSGLTAGHPPKYPAELLEGARMKNLIRDWSSSYDYVVIDSPPFLAVTDAHILSRYTDTTLLIVRHGRSTQKSVERAYQTLHNVAGRKVEVVINAVNRQSPSYGEFYGYKGRAYYSEG